MPFLLATFRASVASVSRAAIGVAAFAVVLAACSSGTIVNTGSERSDAFTAPVDSIYVTVDVTSNLDAYARDFTNAVDTMWTARGLTVFTNADGRLALDTIPGLRNARSSRFPAVLVVSQDRSVTGFMTSPEGGRDFVMSAQLYDTATEDRVWQARIDGTALVDAETVARRFHTLMRGDGVVPE